MPRLRPELALLALLAGACIEISANTTITSESEGTTGGSCPDPNSYWEDDICYCNPGYLFCNDNPDDLSCCPVDGTSGEPPTGTGPGPTTGPTTGSTTDSTTASTTGTTEAVSTTGTTDSTTGSTTDGTTGSTTGGMECTGPRPPPDTCDGGQFWCTQSEVCGPEGSELFRCEGGTWVADPNLAHDSCVLDGYDFAYGCVDDGKSVVFICGEGPGTDCEDADPATCFDDKLLSACTLGKLTHYDCFQQCTEVGDDMMTVYDHGFCGDDMGVSVCLCCDMGDPGCPI